MEVYIISDVTKTCEMGLLHQYVREGPSLGGFVDIIAVERRKMGEKMGEMAKLTFYMPEDIKTEIETRYEEDGSASQSTFVLHAVRFYLNYLGVGKAEAFLPNAVRTTIEGQIGSYEQHVSALLFKQTVEMEMMMRILCDTVEIPEEYLQKVRTKSVKSVKFTNGQLRLEQIAKMGDDSEC